MLTTNDYQVIGMEYNGAYRIDALFASTAWNSWDFGDGTPMPTVNDADTHIYTPVANLTAVRNAPTGEVFWQDRTNNKVWFKVRGGLAEEDPNEPATSNYNLYRAFNIRAFGSATPLPVALLSFKGQNTEGGNLLTWTTASEKNNAGFDIETSADGVNFEKIGFVKGTGTTNAQHAYDFLDKTPRPHSTTYYRLQQTDIDGTQTASSIISIQKNVGTKGLKVYPNPTAQGEISVEYGQNTEGSLLVINAVGQTVFQQKFTPLTTVETHSHASLLKIDISPWSSGVYFIKSGQEVVKFIKN